SGRCRSCAPRHLLIPAKTCLISLLQCIFEGVVDQRSSKSVALLYIEFFRLSRLDNRRVRINLSLFGFRDIGTWYQTQPQHQAVPPPYHRFQFSHTPSDKADAEYCQAGNEASGDVSDLPVARYLRAYDESKNQADRSDTNLPEGHSEDSEWLFQIDDS